MSPTLGKLIQDGADGARVAFGPDGEPTPAAALLEAGSKVFAANADTAAAGVLMTNDQPTVEVVLGAIATGATLVSLPLPSRGADPTAYVKFIREVCATHGVHEIVASDDAAELLESFDLPARRHSELGRAPLAMPSTSGQADPSGFRLVQFSSGSTHLPKPVVLGDEALGANVSDILDVLQPSPGDCAVSWLPLSHDMGLIGMLLTSISAGGPGWVGEGDLVLLDPAEFLRRPATWLETLSRWQGTITAAPDFGFRMATQRPPATPVDLSPLRVAIVGGEIVRAETLASFASTYAQQGIAPEALCPAYGMAEAGVAVTLTPPGEMWRQRVVSTDALAEERLVAAAPGEPASALVASGRPLATFQVACGPDRPDGLDGPGDPGPDAPGPISVRGPSIGADGTTGTSFADADGWYRTGDTGFLDDGWLYVCGRVDDYLVAHGRNIYAPAVEAAVGDVGGVRAGRVTAVGLPTGDWCVVAEPASREALSSAEVGRLRNDIRRTTVGVTSAQPDEIVVVERGALPLTASGKLQRNEVRARLLRGQLPSQDAGT